MCFYVANGCYCYQYISCWLHCLFSVQNCNIIFIVLSFLLSRIQLWADEAGSTRLWGCFCGGYVFFLHSNLNVAIRIFPDWIWIRRIRITSSNSKWFPHIGIRTLILQKLLFPSRPASLHMKNYYLVPFGIHYITHMQYR